MLEISLKTENYFFVYVEIVNEYRTNLIGYFFAIIGNKLKLVLLNCAKNDFCKCWWRIHRSGPQSFLSHPTTKTFS